MPWMHRREVSLAARLWKAQNSQRGDDRDRAAAQDALPLAPPRRSIAMTRRGDEGHAVDQAPPLVAHQRDPPPAEDRDVRASPAPRQLHSGSRRVAHIRGVEIAEAIDLCSPDETKV